MFRAYNWLYKHELYPFKDSFETQYSSYIHTDMQLPLLSAIITIRNSKTVQEAKKAPLGPIFGSARVNNSPFRILFGHSTHHTYIMIYKYSNLRV